MYCHQTKCKLLQSFRCAARGVFSCIRRERNFRIHMTAAFYSAALGMYMRLDRTQWAILLLTQALVLGLELANTAVEAAVDLCAPKHHPLAERAKDAGAGAVLVAAGFSIAVGIFLFWRPRLLELAVRLLTSPRLFLAVSASIAGFAWFIFGFREKIETEKNHTDEI